MTRLRAKDLDSTAILRFKLDSKACDAKTERGVLLKKNEFDCASHFKLGETDGVITTTRILDREVMEVVNLGVVVEDEASETGPQLAFGE